MYLLPPTAFHGKTHIPIVSKEFIPVITREAHMVDYYLLSLPLIREGVNDFIVFRVPAEPKSAICISESY